MKRFVFGIMLMLAGPLPAEGPRVFLAGRDARLLTVLPLSDGTILAGGSATAWDWIPEGTLRVDLPNKAANGWSLPPGAVEGSARRGVILHLSADLEKVLAVVVFPPGFVGGEVASLKTDSPPGQSTGAVYVAGRLADGLEYWLGKLDGNFLKDPPRRLLWGYCEGLGNVGKLPLDAIWDVGGDGRIVFYSYPKRDWGFVARLRADGGGLDTVPEWRNNHGNLQPDGREAKVLALKTGAGDLRSRTWEEFLAIQPDGNGGLRRGSWPDDLYHSVPLGGGPSARGYTGYSSRNTAASSVAIAVDRRNNSIYVGYNVQSILPPWSDIPNAPDFEPAVVAFDPEGRMKWWSRLYTEINAGAGPFVSDDFGATWKRLGSGFVFGAVHDAVVVDGVLVVAENGGISRLEPGHDWRWVTEGIPSVPVTALAASGRSLIAGTARGEIMTSSDLGKTWSAVGGTWPAAKRNQPVTALASNPRNPAEILAYRTGVGQFVSRDAGQTWEALRDAPKDIVHFTFHPARAQLFAVTPTAVFVSPDGLTSWEKLSVPGSGFTSLAIDAANSDRLFVSSSVKQDGIHGIRVSEDGGRTWNEESVGNKKVVDVVAFPGEAEALCATSDRGIFARRPDGKHAWSRLNNAPGLEGATGNFTRLVPDPAHAGKVYAFTVGSGFTSTPDQYVDGLAVDYSRPVDTGDLLVLARAHGNNVSNLWSGREGGSFMRRQTGTRGNEHFHWIGRLQLSDGKFVNATWAAGLDPFGGSFGKPYTDPNLAGWPDHNGGNANLKSSKARSLGLAADGSVFIAGTTRGAITTAAAFQPMTNPLVGKAPWHDFLRVYAPDLSTVTYATALTGDGWNVETGDGADNTHIAAVAALPSGGFVAVGSHDGVGNPIPTARVPAWGKSTPDGEAMMIALFPKTSLR